MRLSEAAGAALAAWLPESQITEVTVGTHAERPLRLR